MKNNITIMENNKNNIYQTIRDLLLNDFDNNLFFRKSSDIYINKPKNIIGIKDLNYYTHTIFKYDRKLQIYKYEWTTELFFGIKNIYIFHDTTVYKNTEVDTDNVSFLNIPAYILNCNLPIKLIKCDLNEFVKLYPEFVDNIFDNFFKYYSYTNSLKGEIYEQSCKCEGLIGSNILPNLIIGQSFDFEKFHNLCDKIKFNEYCKKTFNELQLNGVNCIINVYKSHSDTYSQEVIKKLFDINIEVFSFPLDEDTVNSESNKTNFYLATEKLNQLLNNNKKVYLHCYVGKNRSISVALLYLVKYLKIPLKLACEEIYLKKTFAPQIKFIVEIWNEANNNEKNPIALCKIISDIQNIGNSYSLYSLGFYDVHKLDVISGKKILPLVNDYKKIKQYINKNVF